MRIALERSLKRLGTDYLDLYMAHNIKLHHFNDELFAELDKARDEGKIKAWGVSLGPAIGWRDEGFKALGEAGALGGDEATTTRAVPPRSANGQRSVHIHRKVIAPRSR